MPFITKNTFYKIISEIDLKKDPPPNKARLEGKNLTILSKKERQRLAVISEILGSEFIEENRFFTKLKKPEDTYTMLHPEKIPSYHRVVYLYDNFKKCQGYAVRNRVVPNLTK